MISWNFSSLLLCAVMYYLGFLRVNLYYMIFLYFFISRGVPQRSWAGLGHKKKGASTEAPLWV